MYLIESVKMLVSFGKESSLVITGTSISIPFTALTDSDAGKRDAALKPDPDVDHAQDPNRAVHAPTRLFHLIKRLTHVNIGELVGAVILVRRGFLENVKIVLSCLPNCGEV